MRLNPGASLDAWCARIGPRAAEELVAGKRWGVTLVLVSILGAMTLVGLSFVWGGPERIGSALLVLLTIFAISIVATIKSVKALKLAERHSTGRRQLRPHGATFAKDVP